MKKLVKVFACLALVFSVAGCNKAPTLNDDALDKLEAGIQKMAEVKSMSYELKLQEETTQTDIKVVGEMSQTNGFAFSLAADVGSEGTPAQRLIEMYVKENNLYFNFIGIKQKQTLSESDIESSTKTIEDFKVDRASAEKVLDAATLDGNKITLKFKTDDLNNQFKKKTSTDALGVSLESLSTVTLTLHFEDDFITKASLDMVGVQDGKDINIQGEIAVKDINKTESVSFPDDLDTYPEGNASDLL